MGQLLHLLAEAPPVPVAPPQQSAAPAEPPPKLSTAKSGNTRPVGKQESKAGNAKAGGAKAEAAAAVVRLTGQDHVTE
jgi:hypothetical protein